MVEHTHTALCIGLIDFPECGRWDNDREAYVSDAPSPPSSTFWHIFFGIWYVGMLLSSGVLGLYFLAAGELPFA